MHYKSHGKESGLWAREGLGRKVEGEAGNPHSKRDLRLPNTCYYTPSFGVPSQIWSAFTEFTFNSKACESKYQCVL